MCTSWKGEARAARAEEDFHVHELEGRGKGGSS
jgi:hypothetical protein